MRDAEPGQSLMLSIGEFFGISAARATAIFIPSVDGKYESRKGVIAALRVLLLEKMAQRAGLDHWSTPHIEELADAE